MRYFKILLTTAMLILTGEAMAQTDNVVALLPDGVQANVNPERKQDKAKNLVVAGSPEKGYKAFFAATDASNGEDTLALSHRVQKTVLYICVSFAVSHSLQTIIVCWVWRSLNRIPT